MPDAQAAEQRRTTEALCDSWSAAALSTERCDRPAAEAAVRAAYRAAGLVPPELMIWIDSPPGGVLARAALQEMLTRSEPSEQALEHARRKVRGQLGDALRGKVLDRAWQALVAQLQEQPQQRLGPDAGDDRQSLLWKELLLEPEVQLWNLLSDEQREQLHDQLRGRLDLHPLWHQVRSQIHGQLRGGLRRQHRERIVGSWDPWSEPYSLARTARGLELAGCPPSPQLAALAAAVRATGWWWPMRGVVVLTDRPTVLRCDRQGRLHCGSGPALVYADGYTLYSWRGVTVPADLVTGAGWTIERILAEPNAEIRRCAVERHGWHRFVIDAELARVGDEVPDPGNPGQLLGLYDLPERNRNRAPVRVLLVVNASPDRDGTRRSYGLPVPVDTPDPITAAALTFDVHPDEYRGLSRAT